MRLRALWLAVLAIGCASAGKPDPDQRFFDTQVAPILVKRCLACHNHDLDNANISFQDRDTLIKGGNQHGPVIVPGSPEKSLLMGVLRHDGEVQMPPGKKLPAREIRILTEWVRRGAIWGSKPKQR